MHNSKNNTEVLIIGAGPSGLMMACQLASRNISFLIVDKKEHLSPFSGALLIQPRSLEIFDQLGIAEKALRQGISLQRINFIFNRKKRLNLEISQIGRRLSKFPHILMLEQPGTEQLFIDYLEDHHHKVLHKTELLSFRQDKDCVISCLKFKDDEERFTRSTFLIAADGNQSIVRRHLKIPFPGITNTLSLFLIDNKAEIDLQSHTICFSFSRNISSGIFPLSDGRWRIDGTLPGEFREGKLNFNEIRKKFDNYPIKIKLSEPDWFSVYHSHQRYATSYRNERCFLIGDAAHVVSPIGAQGMNTGIQDACNLAWKIELVLRGKASDSFLDSYQEERLTVAKKLVKSTGRVFEVLTNENFFGRKFRLYGTPLFLDFLVLLIRKRRIFGEFLFKKITEIDIHYKKLRHSSHGFFPVRSPRPGERLPYCLSEFSKENNINIQDKLNPLRFNLFIFTNTISTFDTEQLLIKYRDIISIIFIRKEIETLPFFKKFGITNKGLYLIRPDMYIAFRSRKLNFAILEQFLRRYLCLD